MTLLEKVVIEEMNKTLENGGDVCEDALKILQACQVIKSKFLFCSVRTISSSDPQC
jgi:hypothetical protein